MSLVFLLASVVSLLLGLRRDGLILIFASIVSSVMAALFLAASVRRTSGSPREEGPRPRGASDWKGMPAEPLSSDVREATPWSAATEPLAREPRVGVVDRPLAGRHRVRRERPTAGDANASSSQDVLGPEVIVVSDLGTYHVFGCEQLRGRTGSNRMKRAVARRLGYTPCGVCRPG